MTAEARARLLAALAEMGVTDADYRKIEQARALADEVNTAVAARGGGVVYAVTMLAGAPVPGHPPEILETS